MDWRIDHPCPQCGGPVTLEETDRVLACPFCKVRLHITSRGPFRYCMDLGEQADEVVYVPYWRFKGTLFSAAVDKINNKLLDSSTQAASLDYAPMTLGLRPQLLHLRFATREVPGSYVAPDIPFKDALKAIEINLRLAQVDAYKEESFEKAYIGDNTSIIYAPFFIKGGQLFDAVLKKPVGRLPEDAQMLDPNLLSNHKWSPNFLSAMCPHCGWDVAGETDSCVFLCQNCEKAWRPKDEGFKRVTVQTIGELEKNGKYLPFWRIKAKVEGLNLASVADMVRAANLPKAITEEMENQEFFFWIPAFKVNPQLFVRLARHITSTPFPGELKDKLPQGETHPVNLPLSEAAQSLKICIASFVKPRQTMVMMLPEITVTPQKGSLVYVPFARQGAEFVHRQMNFSVNSRALYYGREM
ncbi:conserved hypothetical protein [Desulfatibacillum aliphaticivorans]|uniref:Uncharacterized protein n=1 Tax=Desulfatibacillum aliphaticivorans TaxID=218208 RepID=B8FN02_DESAL|nr:hypothetical protein [Desulfatibacillum aliphaticivorans]ACL05872.1 conserved hypothetical protein [Desulfatibacillum aliphaticivorans]